MKVNIKNMTLKELEVYFESIGEKKFRAKQVFSWLYKGIYDFDDMTDLSKSLREKLKEKAMIENIVPIRIQKSELDGTRKYLFELRDGNAIESVFMKYKYGNSACISSQAGCRMGCAFCASGVTGLVRNLTAAEMADQIIKIEKDTGDRVGHVVVMGTGEPFDNYDNLCTFINLIHSQDGLNMGLRNITVSTCGVIPKINQFAKDFPQVNLAISLHASNYKQRNTLMPINRKYPMEELITAATAHAERTGRRITFEYALIRGLNDTQKHAEELAALLKGILCHVNLIPLNYVPEKNMVGSLREQAEKFKATLEGKGIEATIRREMGTDISAACGQLRLSVIEN
jgi:23S rRNA (adenine2503-C2)-methyltransferase